MGKTNFSIRKIFFLENFFFAKNRVLQSFYLRSRSNRLSASATLLYYKIFSFSIKYSPRKKRRGKLLQWSSFEVLDVGTKILIGKIPEVRCNKLRILHSSVSQSLSILDLRAGLLSWKSACYFVCAIRTTYSPMGLLFFNSWLQPTRETSYSVFTTKIFVFQQSFTSMCNLRF